MLLLLLLLVQKLPLVPSLSVVPLLPAGPIPQGRGLGSSSWHAAQAPSAAAAATAPFLLPASCCCAAAAQNRARHCTGGATPKASRPCAVSARFCRGVGSKGMQTRQSLGHGPCSDGVHEARLAFQMTHATVHLCRSPPSPGRCSRQPPCTPPPLRRSVPTTQARGPAASVPAARRSSPDCGCCSGAAQRPPQRGMHAARAPVAARQR